MHVAPAHSAVLLHRSASVYALFIVCTESVSIAPALSPGYTIKPDVCWRGGISRCVACKAVWIVKWEEFNWLSAFTHVLLAACTGHGHASQDSCWNSAYAHLPNNSKKLCAV